MQTKKPITAFRFAAPVEMGEEGESGRRFSGIAYSGDAIRDHAFWDNVIFDLSTTKAAQSIPVLLNHDMSIIPGHTKSVEIADNVKVDGLIYADADGAKITGKSGHPWQMSVYIKPERVEEIKAGKTIRVNGREFTGPGHVFRDNTIREVSFTPLGADPGTHASLFSGGNAEVTFNMEASGMDIKELESALAEANTKLADATTKITDLERVNKELSDKFAAQTAERRTADLKRVFAATGKAEPTEDQLKPYLSMEETAFAAVMKDMETFAKASAPAHLFTDLGTPASGSPASTGESPLVANARRRAEASKK